ncbi:cryptochrome 1 [Melia azedarach]|uniref:Cryptochrome 1 n=1 Tax=Melia azedarach TaxID=155640 RepID=A0ACC1WQW2_MELAZ|nr:cryptochrome 1 [Melia azedarach]
MSGGGCSIVWFRRDLRVEDNPALAAGVRAGAVVAVFIWAPEEEVLVLLSSLRDQQIVFLLFLRLLKLTGATQLFFNHLYDPLSLVRDHRAKEVLTAQGIVVRSFNADLLYEPWDVNDAQGRPFTTFAAFWERCLSMPFDPDAPLLPPKRIISGDTSRCRSDTLVFEDESEKGSNALLARAWSPGWSNADKALTTFINGPLIEYSKNRRKADSATTSFLSPHLAFWGGECEKSLSSCPHQAVMKGLFLGTLSSFRGSWMKAILRHGGKIIHSLRATSLTHMESMYGGWLPELARLPTEWIHHPWNAPESVLQAAGIELGSNYPLPIVGIDAAKARLEEALSEMWQQEAASRAAIENGTEEGLGDSSDSAPIAFPQDILMEENPEPARNDLPATAQCYEDQMVPSMTSSLVRVEEESFTGSPKFSRR